VRASDIAARVGGEEFCLILPNTDIDGAMLLSKRMCKKIEDIETEYKHEKLKVTASFGVSEVDINKSVDEALKNTDIALYESKLNGRNRVSLYRSPVIKTMNSEVTS
jgi:diguanylate cyclase (GGDEF)-like protein